MPLFKSFRSKSSLKSSSASVLSENDKSSDFGPRSPSSTTYGSKKGLSPAGDFSSVGRNGSKNTYASGLPASPSAASVRTNQSNTVSATGQQKQQPNLMGVISPSDSFSTTPRPSELYAGKGVQWDSVKLAGPGSSPAIQERHAQNTSEDLQAFLKQRRQWKPTFVTEETVPRSEVPTDLNKLSFMSQDTALNSRGLMSFEDLDKSHQRKQQLLGDNPLGTSSLWESPETSKAGAAKSGAVTNSRNTSSRPIEPLERRTSSFRSAGKISQPPVASNAPKAPSRTSSTQQMPPPPSTVQATKSSVVDAKVLEAAPTSGVPTYSNGKSTQQKQDSGVTNVVAPDKPNLDKLPPPITSTPATTSAEPVSAAKSSVIADADRLKAADPAQTEGASPVVRQSIDTTAGFATPEANSRPVSSLDVQAGANPHVSNGDAQGLASQVAQPETVPEEPTTPRVAKQASEAQAAPVVSAEETAAH